MGGDQRFAVALQVIPLLIERHPAGQRAVGLPLFADNRNSMLDSGAWDSPMEELVGLHRRQFTVSITAMKMAANSGSVVRPTNLD